MNPQLVPGVLHWRERIGCASGCWQSLPYVFFLQSWYYPIEYSALSKKEKTRLTGTLDSSSPYIFALPSSRTIDFVWEEIMSRSWAGSGYNKKAKGKQKGSYGELWATVLGYFLYLCQVAEMSLKQHCILCCIRRRTWHLTNSRIILLSY